jgi:tight adherence protein B
MSSILLFLLTVSCITLLGLWVSGYLVAKHQKEQDQRRARLRLISQPKTQTSKLQVSAFVTAPQQRRRSPVIILAGIVGADATRMSQYPIPWWVVLPACLAVAKGAQVLGSNMLGSASWALLPITWLVSCRYVFIWMEKRRKQKAVLQLPDILDQIIRGVRVGMPVLEAIRTSARETPEPTRSEFLRLVDQVAVGTPLEEAVADMAQRSDLPEYSFLATALALQNQTGGGLSETLIGLADVVRKRVAIVEKGKALSSEAKATAVVLTVLPFATGVIMYVMDPLYMMLLFTEQMGHNMLAAAAVSLILGLLTIRSMFQKALSLS